MLIISDGKWNWMDGSQPGVAGPISQTSSGFFADSSKPWMLWSSRPENGTDFLTSLSFSSSRWLVEPSRFFNSTKHAICEYSFACATCPTGWQKFNGNCFNFAAATSYANWTTLNSYCTNMNSVVWTPRTESLLVYARMQINRIGGDIWVGLSLKSGKWIWSDNNAEVQGESDALDMSYTEPGNTDTVIRIFRDGRALALQVNIRDSNHSMGGFNPTVSYGQVCQMGATAPTYDALSNLIYQRGIPIVGV